MKTLFILVAIAVFASSTAYGINADKLWTESVAELEASVTTKDAGISNVIRYRDSACSQPMSAERQKVCLAAYNAVIANRRAEKAAIELATAAMQLDYSDHERQFLVQALYPKEFEVWLDTSVTNGLWTRVWRVFPDPTYKAK